MGGLCKQHEKDRDACIEHNAAVIDPFNLSFRQLNGSVMPDPMQRVSIATAVHSLKIGLSVGNFAIILQRGLNDDRELLEQTASWSDAHYIELAKTWPDASALLNKAFAKAYHQRGKCVTTQAPTPAKTEEQPQKFSFFKKAEKKEEQRQKFSFFKKAYIGADSLTVRSLA